MLQLPREILEDIVSLACPKESSHPLHPMNSNLDALYQLRLVSRGFRDKLMQMQIPLTISSESQIKPLQRLCPEATFNQDYIKTRSVFRAASDNISSSLDNLVREGLLVQKQVDQLRTIKSTWRQQTTSFSDYGSLVLSAYLIGAHKLGILVPSNEIALQVSIEFDHPQLSYISHDLGVGTDDFLRYYRPCTRVINDMSELHNCIMDSNVDLVVMCNIDETEIPKDAFTWLVVITH